MKYFLLGIIKFYQMIPISSHSLCRYTPTCSEYAIESIKKYGTVKGCRLTFLRILRCRKKGGFGYDPIQ